MLVRRKHSNLLWIKLRISINPKLCIRSLIQAWFRLKGKNFKGKLELKIWLAIWGTGPRGAIMSLDPSTESLNLETLNWWKTSKQRLSIWKRFSNKYRKNQMILEKTRILRMLRRPLHLSSQKMLRSTELKNQFIWCRRMIFLHLWPKIATLSGSRRRARFIERWEESSNSKKNLEGLKSSSIISA